MVPIKWDHFGEVYTRVLQNEGWKSPQTQKDEIDAYYGSYVALTRSRPFEVGTVVVLLLVVVVGMNKITIDTTGEDFPVRSFEGATEGHSCEK